MGLRGRRRRRRRESGVRWEDGVRGVFFQHFWLLESSSTLRSVWGCFIADCGVGIGVWPASTVW